MANPSPQAEYITLTGASGTRYQFEVHRWGTELRPIGGMYAVLRYDPDGYRTIYVGQTGNLAERFDDHHQAKCFAMNRKSHIAVLPEASLDRRCAVETDIRRHYNPPCNQQ